MRIEQLTFTRFIAALIVVIYHFGRNIFPFTISPLDHVASSGMIAVSYFFALSGFIMAVVYYQQGQAHTFNKRNYWSARLARIYPVYLLALIIAAIPAFLFNVKVVQHTENSLFAFVLNATLLQAWLPPHPTSFNPPAWSLSVEAFFYLCFPFILLAIQRFGIKKLCITAVLLWAASLVSHALLNYYFWEGQPSLSNDFVHFFPLFHLNTFLLGLAVGVLYKDGHLDFPALQRYNGLLIILTLSLIVLLLSTRYDVTEWLGYQKNDQGQLAMLYTNGFLAPVFLALIVLLCKSRGTLLRHKFFVLLGEISYAMYLLHGIIYIIMDNVIFPQLLAESSPEVRFAVFIAILLVISYLAFRYLETPARAKIKRLLASKENKVTGTSSVANLS